MGDPANVRAWGTGKVFVAPLGTTMPTDITTALAVAWKDLGILDQDAGAEWDASEDASDYFGWGVGRVRTLYSKYKRSLKVTAAETNATVIALLNPSHGATTALGVTTFAEKAPTHVPKAFVVEETDGTITRRRCIKSATVMLSSATKDAETGTSLYELTIDIQPDSTGALWTEITDDPALVALDP